MTDLDLDRLGDVWRQRPTAAEMESLRRTADAVRRKARWGQYVDAAAAVLVAAVVVILVLSNPKIDTLLVGARPSSSCSPARRAADGFAPRSCAD